MPEPTSTTQEPQVAPEQPAPGTGPRIVTPAPEQPAAPAQGDAQPEDGEEPRGGSNDLASTRREAASWRQKFRDAESTIAAHEERIAGLQRADADRVIADRLVDPRDLWAVTDVADLRDDDGALDQEKVTARIEALIEERPHWAKAAPATFPSGVRGVPTSGTPSFGERIKAAREGGGR